MEENKFFTQLNREYRKAQGNSPAKRAKLSAISKLNKLKEYMESQKVLDMFADYSDTETGDLYHYDTTGLIYILKAEDIKKLFPTYVPYGNSYLLGTSFKVTIKEISEDGNILLNPVECSINNEEYLKYERNSKSLASHAARLENVLHEGIKASGKKPLIRGTVTSVEKDRIFLDIFDTGVIGVVPVKNYAEQFRRDLRDIVAPGDSLKGVVFAYRAREGESEQHFLVSTADYLSDPWVNAKRFHVGDVIVVKCVEKADTLSAKKQYFWGVSRVLPNIDIMCDYGTKMPSSSIVVGHYYRCKMKDIDLNKHHLKVVPFSECGSYELGMDKL